MKDSEFKELIRTTFFDATYQLGEQLDDGYKPDAVVLEGENVSLIFESEQKTDRKAFLGSLVKAQFYACKNNQSPHLIIVMREFENTRVTQMIDHLSLYIDWLMGLSGEGFGLKSVQIISDKKIDQLLSNRKSLTDLKNLASDRFVWPK